MIVFILLLLLFCFIFIKRAKNRVKKDDGINPYIERHLDKMKDDEIYNEWFVEFLNSIIIKLNPGGMAIIEGHENHLNEIMILVKSKNSQIKEIEILKDYTKRDRFLKIRK